MAGGTRLDVEATHIDVEVVFAAPQHAVAKTFRMALAATVAEVLRAAAASAEFAQIDVEHCAIGVFGRVVAPGHLLSDGDRVELYRPLAADPKEARRARAGSGRPGRGTPRPR